MPQAGLTIISWWWKALLSLGSMNKASVDILHCVSSVTEEEEIAKMMIVLILKNESSPYYEGIKGTHVPRTSSHTPVSCLSLPPSPARRTAFQVSSPRELPGVPGHGEGQERARGATRRSSLEGRSVEGPAALLTLALVPPSYKVEANSPVPSIHKREGREEMKFQLCVVCYGLSFVALCLCKCQHSAYSFAPSSSKFRETLIMLIFCASDKR